MMMARKSCGVVAALVAAAIASAARGDVTVNVINTGAPKVPTGLDPSGFMQGYTGYILQLVSDSDTIGTIDTGDGSTGVAISGTFSQVWTSSSDDAISGGTGYDTFSPGLSSFNNSAPSMWNADSHFLGDPSLAISNVVENGTFLAGSNQNALASKNNDARGFGIGTRLVGLVSLLPAARFTTMDVAYLVVPDGASFTFNNMQVITNPTTGYLISYPDPNFQASWNSTSGGSWSAPENWSRVAKIDGFITPVSSHAIPSVRGDSAAFGTTFTGPATITLDGDKTISYLTLGSNYPLTLAQGSGGKLIFDKGDVSSAFIHGNSPALLIAGKNAVISAPIQLNTDTTIGSPGLELSGPITSGGASPAGLVISTGNTLLLSGDNSYSGSTYVTGTLQVGNGGTTGSLGTGPVLFTNPYANPPAPAVGNVIFNRSDVFTVPNDISGTGNITQAGSGTLILSGYTNYLGTTTILGGSLIRTNPGPGTSITLAPGAVYSNWVTPQGSLANLFATSSAGLQTKAAFRAGVASAQTQINLSFRLRTVSENAVLVSDVVNVSGMSPTVGVETVPFALELSYSDASLGNESLAAAHGQLFLGWLNDSSQWVNATAGNFDHGFTVIPNFQGSWAQFASAFSVTDGNVGNFLGSWGVDITGNTVWAVLNHNSQYSVTVPEPFSIVSLGLGSVCMMKRRRRALNNRS